MSLSINDPPPRTSAVACLLAALPSSPGSQGEVPRQRSLVNSPTSTSSSRQSAFSSASSASRHHRGRCQPAWWISCVSPPQRAPTSTRHMVMSSPASRSSSSSLLPALVQGGGRRRRCPCCDDEGRETQDGTTRDGEASVRCHRHVRSFCRSRRHRDRHHEDVDDDCGACTRTASVDCVVGWSRPGWPRRAA